MQKVSLYLVLISALLVLTGCARSGSLAPTQEEIRQFLKLRGYEFDEPDEWAVRNKREKVVQLLKDKR